MKEALLKAFGASLKEAERAAQDTNAIAQAYARGKRDAYKIVIGVIEATKEEKS